MRVAALAAVAALLTACSSAEPMASPTSASPPSSTAPTTTTTNTPTSLLPLWEKRLPALSPRGMCPTEATFEPSCLQAILDFRKTVDEIGDQADKLGARYVTVEKAAAEVDEAIEQWASVCATSRPNSPERWECLKTRTTVLDGDEAILATMYAVERP